MRYLLMSRACVARAEVAIIAPRKRSDWQELGVMLRIMSLREAAPCDASDPARDSRLPMHRETSVRFEHTSPRRGRQALR